MNRQATTIKAYEFVACSQALLKLNVDNEKTLSRLKQLFATPTAEVGVRLVKAQKNDYDHVHK